MNRANVIAPPAVSISDRIAGAACDSLVASVKSSNESMFAPSQSVCRSRPSLPITSLHCLVYAPRDGAMIESSLQRSEHPVLRDGMTHNSLDLQVPMTPLLAGLSAFHDRESRRDPMETKIMSGQFVVEINDNEPKSTF